MKVSPINIKRNPAPDNILSAQPSFRGADTIVKTTGKIAGQAVEEVSKKASGKIAQFFSTHTISFKKMYDEKITEGIAYKIGELATTKWHKAIVNTLAKYAKKMEPAAALSHLASFSITFFYMQNTKNSKKIPEERKPSLMINMLGLTVVSSFITTIVDNKTKKLLGSLNKAYKELNPDKSAGEYKKFAKVAKKMKSLTVFSFIVRYAVPVLMVPVTGAIVKKFNEHKEKKEKEFAQNQSKTQNPQAATYLTAAGQRIVKSPFIKLVNSDDYHNGGTEKS